MNEAGLSAGLSWIQLHEEGLTKQQTAQVRCKACTDVARLNTKSRIYSQFTLGLRSSAGGVFDEALEQAEGPI